MTPSLAHIARFGACISCGLCEAVGSGDVRMTWTREERLRPVGAPCAETTETIAATCPALVSEGLNEDEAGAAARWHPVWGWMRRSVIGWAADPVIRHRASAGGVLSALAAHILASGQADFILHLTPDPARPARSRYRIRETPEEAAATGGSRYGPAAPLSGLVEAKARGGRFAFIGKPCDISAIRLLAKREDWLAARLTHRLTIMCGGASEFRMTAKLLEGWGIDEADLSRFAYRGEGNPGATAAETRDGRRAETTYQSLWCEGDAATWDLQHRCKICPDSIGMAGDLVAYDCWPGGAPAGEDEGFNAILTRTAAGDALLDGAVEAGAVALGREVSDKDIVDYQPHQVAQRRAAGARIAAQRAMGRAAPTAPNLGLG